MFKSKLILNRKFYPKDIIVSYTPSLDIKIPEGIERKIDEKWQELSSEAKGKGMKWFNGKMYCLNKIEEKDHTLSIELSTSDFKHNQCEFFVPELIELGEDYFIKTIFVSSILQTSDNKYVLGKRGKKLDYRKDIDMIGGVLQQSENIIKNSSELFDALHNEFKEEIGLDIKSIKDGFLNYIILTDTLRIGLYFNTLLNISSADLLNLFKQSNDKEMQDLLFLDKEEFISTLKTLTDAKALLASIL